MTTEAREELAALWVAIFGGPPVIDAEPSLMAEILLRCSPPPPLYRLDGAPSPAPPSPPE